MSTATIPDLTPRPTLDGTELFEISFGGNSFHTSLNNISTFLPVNEVFTWTANHDANGFVLEDARFGAAADPTKILDLNLAGMTTGIVLTLVSAQSTAQSITIPNITGADVFVTENFAQTLVSKTLTLPTIADFTNATHDHLDAAGGGLITVAALSDESNIALLNRTNSYTAGVRQNFLGSTGGTSGINIGGLAGNPLSFADGDIWLNTSTNQIFGRINGANVDLSAPSGEVFTWTANHSAANFDLTNVGVVDFGLTSSAGTQITGDNTGLTLAAGGTGESIFLDIFSTLEYEFTQTELDFNGNNIRNPGFILDDNQNELVGFNLVAAAVNFIQITNSITATGPIIETVGTDANITLNLLAKGTGIIDTNNFPLSIGTGYIDIAEDAAPPNPAANVGRLYVADVASVTSLFFVDNAGTATNLLTVGGSQTPWVSNIDAAGFQLNDVGDIDASMANATEVWLLTSEVAGASDTGTEPMMVLNARRDTPAAIVNRDLFRFANNAVSILDVQVNGTWAFVGQAFTGITSIIDDTVVATAPGNTFIHMDSSHYVIWDTDGASVNWDGIRTNSNQFEFYLATVLSMTFDSAGLDVLAKDIAGVNNLFFEEVGSLPTSTLTYIQESSTALSYNVPTTRIHELLFNNVSEYSFSETIADFKGNTLRDVPIIEDTNNNEVLAFTGIVNADDHILIINSDNGVSSSGPIITADGVTANPDLILRAKSTGSVIIQDGNNNEVLRTVGVASAVNEVEITNAVTTVGPTIAPQGETNIDLIIIPKGTGDLILGSNTAGEGLGFYGVTPVVKGAALTAQDTTLTHTAPGTPDFAIQDLTTTTPFGFVTKDEGNTVLQVIVNLQTRVAELEARLDSSTGVGLFA